MFSKVLCCVLLFGAVIVADSFGAASALPDYRACQDHQNKEDCESTRIGDGEGAVQCIFDDTIIGPDTPCVVDINAVAQTFKTGNRRSLGGEDKIADSFNGQLFKPPSQEDFNKLADKVDVKSSELGKTNGAKRRSLSINPFLLGSSIFGTPTFPECPVHVKFCYRVPCGGYGNKYLESNPKQCLSDPRCCYDYKLAYMKKIFGHKFMGGAPACYYGATSKQWMYITNYFKPWNPYYAKFILQAFEAFFNTNAYDFAGKFVCKSDFRRKAYPVGSKSELQCNLVSGCWNEDLPEGSQCLMASELISQLFQRSQVYPSLFTNDPADTKCSANWYQYGPKAYNRMPCGVGPAPTKISQILGEWCPPQECCLNYAALSKDEKSDFMSYYLIMQNFGSGFSPFGASPAQGLGFPLGGIPDMQNPFGGWNGPAQHGPVQHGPAHQTPYDPRIFYYLLSASSSSMDVSDIFCPYKNTFNLGIFPDFSEYTDGCCDIPKCYHKKKLIKRSYPYPYRPTVPPTRPPVQAMWGAWEECRAPCDTTGTRYRKCYVGNRQQPGLCPGTASQECTGKPCPVQYYWGPWTANGPCSRTCGGGYMSYRRTCYGGGKLVDSYHCNGSPTKSDICEVKPCEPEYKWSLEFVQVGPCSETCGQGYAVWSRQCVSAVGGVVSDRLCQGIAQRQTRLCVQDDCPALAEWGPWKPFTECGATCGPRGILVERRQCYVNGDKTDSKACGEPDERIQRCAAPDCPMEYYWTGFIAEPCRKDPSGNYCTMQRSRKRSKRCYEYAEGRYTYVNPQSRCGRPREDTIPCIPQQCMQDNGGY